FRCNTRGDLRPPIVDTKDPILKPWAAKHMQEMNEEVLSGKMAIPFTSQSRCWPGGVPGQLLFLQPTYFIQTPKQVWMIWERDQFVRRIYLTDKHSENVKPSWFGESIGHYEGGDTLVVDTIGLAGGKNHYIDSFRTPHTEKLHVVERFTISKDAKTLTAIITVEDPDTFNGPLTLKQTWRRNEKPMAEMVCAEDVADHFNQDLHPIPQLDKAGVDTAHIIGAKAGGAIATQFAADYPARTRTLSVIHVATADPNRSRPATGAAYAPQLARLGSAASKEMVDYWEHMFATEP